MEKESRKEGETEEGERRKVFTEGFHVSGVLFLKSCFSLGGLGGTCQPWPLGVECRRSRAQPRMHDTLT